MGAQIKYVQPPPTHCGKYEIIKPLVDYAAEMGTHSDGYVEQELLTTFVTCEGDLSDPQFNTKFARLLKQLKKLLLKDSGQYLGVVKVEPWNSVRVTFTVPKEAALRLRQLAQQGDATLSQLGILSVQLEGDQAISLRIAGRVSGESQEIVLRTTPADDESIGSQSSAPEADHMISKNVVVSASGGTASFIRTMTQLVSGSAMSQPLSSFKNPNMVSSISANPAFSVSPKVSPAVISTATKTTIPHSYHSPFVATSPLPVAAASTQSREALTNHSTSSPRFPLPPPPPYPLAKNATTNMLKLNRPSSDETTTNPSPANVALSSPLLVNLLQNDGGVPLNNCKPPIADKQKMKPSVKAAAVPASTAKRKDSVPGTPPATASQPETPPADASSSAAAASNAESQVIQRIQRASASASEPLTMVTNVRIPVEACNSESVIVSSGKLPAMNHLTVATANVKQNFANQGQLVNLFQGQFVPAGSSAGASNPPKAAALMANQFLNRVAAVENQQLLSVGQAPKLGVRVINVSQQQQQQHLLQSQQLASTKQLLQQQPFQAHTQQQLLLQQQSQLHVLQQQKSVISQSTPSAKINVSTVQELNKLCMNPNSPVVSSVVVSGNRFINQFALNQIPQQVSAVLPGSNEQRLDTMVAERNAALLSESNALLEQVDKAATMPVQMQNMMMADGNTCHMKKSESAASSLPNGGNRVMFDSIATCAALQLVKTLTFTNPNQVAGGGGNFGLPGMGQEPKLNPKYTPMLSSQGPMPAAFNASASTYPNSIVTNSSAVSGEKYFDANVLRKGGQLNDLQAAVYAKADADKVFQKANLPQYATSAAAFENQQPSAYVSSTTQLPAPPQYSLLPSPDDVRRVDKKERENAREPSPFGEKEPQFLINPLTGELEAMPTESSDNESDQPTDVFNSLPPSVANNEDSCFSYSSPMTNEKSNSMYSDDEDDLVTSSTLKKADEEAIKSFNGGDASMGRQHRILAGSPNTTGAEKIKIRLKLEKSEPISNAYKVDVLNSALKKVDKPTSIVKPMPRVLTTSASSAGHQNSMVSSAAEEPRVPPIRLSLRGKNLTVVKKNKKWSDVEAKESIVEEGGDKKGGYFNSKSRMSPCELISEKESCLAGGEEAICKLAKEGGVEEGDDLKLKLSKGRKAESGPEDVYSLPATEGGDAFTSYSSLLPSVRTFPTQAEVKSILRSVPTDPHNKMSLTSMKLKKKENKKKFCPRDRSSSMLANSAHGDEPPDAFARVINETKSTLSSQSSRGKSKSTPTSLLKKVMKSGAADPRFMNMANRGAEKRVAAATPGTMANFVANEAPPIVVVAKGGSAATQVVLQRRSSADVTYSVSGSTLAGAKLNPRSSEALVTPPPQYQTTMSHAVNNLYAGSGGGNNNASAGEKAAKKFMVNAVAAATAAAAAAASKKVANNCKGRDYQSAAVLAAAAAAVAAKNDSKIHANHETKKTVVGHLAKKNAAAEGAECKPQQQQQQQQPNVVVNCVQTEAPYPATPVSGVSLADKMQLAQQQRLLEEGEPARKKARLEAESGPPAGNNVGAAFMDHHHQLLHHPRLMALPTTAPATSTPTKDVDLGVSMGGDSPSAHTTEQTNNQGEDSGIESMDALSEKSPNQGESPCRKDEKEAGSGAGVEPPTGADKKSANAYCDKTTAETFAEESYGGGGGGLAACGRGGYCANDAELAKAPNQAEASNDGGGGAKALELPGSGHNSVEAFGDEEANAEKAGGDCKAFDERNESLSPDLDDVQPFRVTPALYTYSNPEKMRVDSPSPVLEDITDEISLSPKSVIVEQPKTSTRLKRKRKESSDPMYITADRNKTGMGRYNNRNNNSLGGKSLLEQLLIEIPQDNNVESRRSGMPTRNTRSQVKGLSQPSPDTLSVCSTSSSSSIRTPKCSPVPRTDESNKPSPRPSSRLTSRRPRKGSESSNVSNSDESSSYGGGKRKAMESTAELMKGCMGFEEQNGKKVAISAVGAVDYRPMINENSIISTHSAMVTSSKAGAAAGRKTANVTENVSQSSNASRPVGKRRKTVSETGNKRGTYKSLASVDLIQVATNEIQGQDSKHLSTGLPSVSSTTVRGNSRLANTNVGAAGAAAKQALTTTPATSRRSVRQNHLTRRRKSPATVAVAAASEDACPSLPGVGTASNNNNCTNKNNNNNNNNNSSSSSSSGSCSSGNLGSGNNCGGGGSGANTAGSSNATGKTSFSNNEGVSKGCGAAAAAALAEKSAAADKTEAAKSAPKLNYNVTKKEALATIAAAMAGGGSGADKNGGGAGCGAAGVHGAVTITTRGSSVKHTHPAANDSAIAAPPHDVSQAHPAPASEEVINTRRKTRSVANLNDSEHASNRRRRNSRDGK